MLHDYGKYTDCFQQMIVDGEGRCPHAIYGAMSAFSKMGPDSRWIAPATFAIAGHHAGLSSASKLGDNLNGNQEESKAQRSEAKGIWQRAIQDQPGIAALFDGKAPAEAIADIDVFTRMLFSCLVDADRLDTCGRPNIQTPLDADLRLKKLKTYLTKLEREATGSAIVNEARAGVQEACRQASTWPEQILSLSVPTGGGKTLAAAQICSGESCDRAGKISPRHRGDSLSLNH